MYVIVMFSIFGVMFSNGGIFSIVVIVFVLVQGFFMIIMLVIEYKIFCEGVQGWVISGEYVDNGDFIICCDIMSGYFKVVGVVEYMLLFKYGVNVVVNMLLININFILDNVGYEVVFCVENLNYCVLIVNGKFYLMIDGFNWIVNVVVQFYIDVMYVVLSLIYGGIGLNGVYGI